ncbi:hypothetical protein F4821DRAFT_264331 [Hypoxylon rubiginosum]|uniref:Uncharacterized protein n=1 Tax=Hypoxylon rubiginosum TaxID=110542 RepID=A0ACC0CNP6_9PEZI|nr:hypothetical protein F4821DRAFT_264331 [Hypoxylon rubiginosum]
MKFSVAIFAIFTTVAMAELQKVPRSQKPAKAVEVRQAGAQVQTAAMSNANGDVVTFDTAGVYKASTEAGI